MVSKALLHSRSSIVDIGVVQIGWRNPELFFRYGNVRPRHCPRFYKQGRHLGQCSDETWQTGQTHLYRSSNSAGNHTEGARVKNKLFIPKHSHEQTLQGLFTLSRLTSPLRKERRSLSSIWRAWSWASELISILSAWPNSPQDSVVFTRFLISPNGICKNEWAL